MRGERGEGLAEGVGFGDQGVGGGCGGGEGGDAAGEGGEGGVEGVELVEDLGFHDRQVEKRGRFGMCQLWKSTSKRVVDSGRWSRTRNVVEQGV